MLREFIFMQNMQYYLISLFSPSKTPVKNSPCKSSPILSARARFGDLVKLQSDEVVLALPRKYQILKEAFRAVDTVLSLLYNRKETATFSRLKSGVEEMLRSYVYDILF